MEEWISEWLEGCLEGMSNVLRNGLSEIHCVEHVMELQSLV